MKVLIVGNSLVACLMAAYRKFLPKADIIDYSFYCVPGGGGPNFTIENGKLQVSSHGINPDYPPFVDAPETLERSVEVYDAILVSALGVIGGGFVWPSHLMTCGILHGYRPHAGMMDRPLVSKSCYREIIVSSLRVQPGIQFLDTLKEAYAGKIVVQPFPNVTSSAPQSEEWIMNETYEDAVGAYRFFSESRDQFLFDTCSRLGADLLPYPVQMPDGSPFTPSEYIQHKDGLHPNVDYGKLVIDQFLERI